MSRVDVRPSTRKVCVGDLNHRIKLLPRDMTEPGFGETDFGEDFTGGVEAWAKVYTTAGKTIFNGVNTDVNVTHEIYIRFQSGVGAETWVELQDGTRLDVVMSEDLDERKEWLLLLCTERGSGDLGANLA